MGLITRGWSLTEHTGGGNPSFAWIKKEKNLGGWAAPGTQWARNISFILLTWSSCIGGWNDSYVTPLCDDDPDDVILCL